MNLKVFLRLLIAAGFFPLFFYVIVPWLNYRSAKYDACDTYVKVYNESFKGRVKRKFWADHRGTDWNVVYTDSGKGELVRDFPEFVGLYAFVNPGDSIIKKPKTTWCIVRSISLKRDSIFGYKNLCADSLTWGK